MYARRLKVRNHHWGSLLQKYGCSSRSTRKDICQLNSPSKSRSLKDSFIRNYNTQYLLPRSSNFQVFKACHARSLSNPSRFFSSESDGSNASEGGKHCPVKDASSFENRSTGNEQIASHPNNKNEHDWLGKHDQQEWLDLEKLSIESKKKESPFLTKRQRFKNEFLRRVVPWDKIKVSWSRFPYSIHEFTKESLVDCAASHLKHKRVASSFGPDLLSSGGKIMLQGAPGTELYRERMVKALARELQVPLLILDSNVLAPYDFGQESVLGSESDDEHAASAEEATSESDAEPTASNDEWTSGEGKSSESGDDNDDVQASADAIKKLVPHSLEEFAKRVSGAVEDDDEAAESTSEDSSKRPIRKGDRVKYSGATVHLEVENRSLVAGQRGEVYEINGDQVAVILDNAENKTEEGSNTENGKQPDGKPSVYWIDIQDVVKDLDTQMEDWLISVEALCEILPSLQPVIVYFPDCSQWLSKAVPRSNYKEFISKVEEMLDKVQGPVVFICGENNTETGSKEKGKFTMVLPGLGRLAQVPLPLKRLTEGLGESKSSNDKNISQLFSNIISVHPPMEEDQLRIFNKQVEVDQNIITSRNNIVELYKVLRDHDLACADILRVNTDGLVLTKRQAEKIVGWAKNHYLSSTDAPSIKGDKLIIPVESLDAAITRLMDEEKILKKPSQNLKRITKDEYEKAFVHALIPPNEIGVKFDDIGALEDVKKTLNELVSLPMKRPELFTRGNLLRPCKGILLFGPPGTGKTLLAKALATEAGANFLNITSSSLTSKWFGDAEKLTRALFSFARRLTPVVIFIDEVDSLLGARGGAFEHEATRRMRNEFMAAWDGLKSKDSQQILILAATNRPFDLDDAVIRRLPRRIYVDLPNAENRTKILKVLLSKENLESDFKFDELANATEGYSGSDLKNLCITASYMPVQELLEEERKGGRSDATPSLRSLKLEDFVKAKSKVSASVAYDATSMNSLREWNEKYGEDGSRIQSPFGFGSFQ